MALRQEIQQARERLSRVQVPEAMVRRVAEALSRMHLPSMRAELALLEAARAHAAAEDREAVQEADVRAVASLVLPLRRREEVDAYFETLEFDTSSVRPFLDIFS